MNTSAVTARPRKTHRVWKVLLRIFGTLLAFLAISIAALAVSTTFRDWTATKLVSDPIVRDRLAGLPPRTEPLPVRKLMVRMRDGVELSTQVFLPQGAGPWPVIVVRDPYSFGQYVSCPVYVRFGYGCVYQEVRGRGPSQGTWYPFTNERKDGLDLIAWILKQPWQNGRLALLGGSYLGVVQWAVAGDLPPEVKTFVPTVAHGDVYDLAYRNGVFNQGVAGAWLYAQGRSILGTLVADSNWLKKIAGKFPAQGVAPSEFALGWDAYRDYIQHPDKDDAYWQSPEYVALRDAHRKVHVPVMMIGSANDFFLPGMLRVFEELPTRESSVFMIGPGNHGGQVGPEVQSGYTRGYADTLAWLDHHLRDAPMPERLRPGVNVFVHGTNSWMRFDRWPVPIKPLVLHLDKLSAAQPCDGGALVGDVPAPGQTATYAYDPRQPVPTRGGPFNLMGDAVVTQGNDLCDRTDVLSFSSLPFMAETLINGSIRVSLRVSSDAADTAFTVKLSEHMADGRVYNIRDDISSLSMRNKAQHRMSYTPGEPVELVFDLTPILWHMKPSSRLRLDVSSSSAPAFFPHPNKAGLWSEVKEPAVAQQTVHGGTLELPTQ